VRLAFHWLLEKIKQKLASRAPAHDLSHI
jgi:hypothetical protein